MNNHKLNRLQKFATKCREDIIRMSALGGCFIGASLSCIDMIVYLYNEFLNITDMGIDSDRRDYFILSKGHDVPALYSVLARLDIIDYDNQILNFKYKNLNLTVPHKDLTLRNFVLFPLQEISSEWKHPITKESISFLIDNLSERDKKSILKIKKN